MTTSEVERRLSAVLDERAEQAMQVADTRGELVRFQQRVDTFSGGRSRATVAAMAAAVAAAAAILLALLVPGPLPGRDDSLPADSRVTQTADERVAQDFVEALGAYDADLAASLLAEDARVPYPIPDWLRRGRALRKEFFFDPCRQTSSSGYGTHIGCPFAYHAFGSEQLGRGPFGDNIVSLVVTDGEVRAVEAIFNFELSGEGELYEKFGSWVRAHHPDDWAFLKDETPSVGEERRWVRLWQLRIEQFVDSATR